MAPPDTNPSEPAQNLSLTRNDIHQYWKVEVNTKSGRLNDPIMYVSKSTELPEILVKLWNPEVKPNHIILELGCNAGHILDYIQKAGYHKLLGIEINQKALKVMKKTYPDLYVPKNFYCSPIETAIQHLHDRTIDVMFSVATLQHVHTESDFVFREIARVADKYIITVENESKTRPRFYPRNYQEIFEPFGWKQIKETELTGSTMSQYTTKTRDTYTGYTARMFSRSNGGTQ